MQLGVGGVGVDASAGKGVECVDALVCGAYGEGRGVEVVMGLW